jgi:hypothetical protein
MESNLPLKRSITYEDKDEEMEIARKKIRECGYLQPTFNTEGNGMTAARGNGMMAAGGSRHIEASLNMIGGCTQSTEEGRAIHENDEQDNGMPIE